MTRAPSPHRRWAARLGALALLVGVTAPVAAGPATAAPGPTVAGHVTASTGPLEGFRVTLLEAGAAPGAGASVLGEAVTDAGGAFSLTPARAPASGAVAYLLADDTADGPGGPVVLASVLGAGALPPSVVVNERTTVAGAYALAQFATGDALAGTAPGPRNAATMAHNLADPATGELDEVLTTSPNGSETSTLAAFDSLTNLAAACVDSTLACTGLLAAASAPGEPVPTNLFQALATIARNPGHAVVDLYALTLGAPIPATPALDHPPVAWTIALRFDGDGHSVAGPGNFAIDHEGNLYVLNNYQYDADPHTPVCGSDLLLKFKPNGEYFPGTPFTGGGLSGAGFGIDIDAYGDIWVANYGFAAPAPGCPADQQPPHNSMSKFTPEGVALSPATTATSTGGFTQGNLGWPQGTIVAENGDVWIANCSNATVTRYIGGDPDHAQSIGNLGLHQPFGVVESDGHILVSDVGGAAVAVLGLDGTPTASSPVTGGGLDHPMGVAADADGNVWVANSGVISLPCPDRPTVNPELGSLTLLAPDGTPRQATAFHGGGLTVPWGVATDGDGNVWVANFAGKRLANFCGTDPTTCPPGTATGDPISPDVTGYFFDGLVRNTGVAVDPSGNVWLTNNWEEIPFQTNPGGHQIVAYLGIAAPVLVDAPIPKPTPPSTTTPTSAPTTVVAATPVATDPRFTG